MQVFFADIYHVILPYRNWIVRQDGMTDYDPVAHACRWELAMGALADRLHKETQGNSTLVTPALVDKVARRLEAPFTLTDLAP